MDEQPPSPSPSASDRMGAHRPADATAHDTSRDTTTTAYDTSRDAITTTHGTRHTTHPETRPRRTTRRTGADNTRRVATGTLCPPQSRRGVSCVYQDVLGCVHRLLLHELEYFKTEEGMQHPDELYGDDWGDRNANPSLAEIRAVPMAKGELESIDRDCVGTVYTPAVHRIVSFIEFIHRIRRA